MAKRKSIKAAHPPLSPAVHIDHEQLVLAKSPKGFETVDTVRLFEFFFPAVLDERTPVKLSPKKKRRFNVG
jgi:hypothetical protein